MLFTSLAPNTEFDDALYALSILMRPWRWRSQKAVRELEAAMSRRIGPQYAVAFESGRTALHALLATHGIAAQDEVVMQAYTCVAVPNAVLWAGARPIFVDIDETLTMSPQDLERKITPRTKALIIQHTFGMPARMHELVTIARAHRLFIIEDCAHVIGTSYEGKLLGSIGDASFFSFGRDKVISSVFGGMALTHNEYSAEQLRTLQQGMPAAHYGWIFQQLLHPIIMWSGKYFYAHGGRWLIAAAKRYGWTSRALEPEERSGGKPAFTGKQMPDALARLALHQFKKLERFTAHRIACAEAYQTALGGIVRTQQRTSSEAVPLIRFALWHEQAQTAATSAAAAGLFLGDWYDTPVAPRDTVVEKIGYIPGSCPIAEDIARKTINLPTDIHATKTAIATLVNHLRNALSTTR